MKDNTEMAQMLELAYKVFKAYSNVQRKTCLQEIKTGNFSKNETNKKHKQ